MTFSDSTDGPKGPASPPLTHKTLWPAHRNEITVSGTIHQDTVWNADKVNVTGDILIQHGVLLTIVPGALVEFQDYYKIDVKGALEARGHGARPIVFTIHDPQNFQVNASTDGCWNGIEFDGTLATNKKSVLEFCVFEYSKAAASNGGVVSAYNFSKFSIRHCVFRHNAAQYGGAVFLYMCASPDIVSNLFYCNHALQNASAIYCAYSCPRIIHNTITNNPIHNTENPYIDTCSVLNFLSKPIFWNNIIRNNDPEINYNHFQVLRNKDYYTHFNNIEDYRPVNGNMDVDPLFADASQWDYHLTHTSPCKDAGDDSHLSAKDMDFEGDPRESHLGVDMGADEFHTHLYHTGDPTPGSQVTIKYIGAPGSGPVVLWVSAGSLAAPIQLPGHGWWHLGFPLILQANLGYIGAANGVLAFSSPIPITMPAPLDLYLQGAIGNELTNLCILKIK